jgi:predicted metal-dependent peptidase
MENSSHIRTLVKQQNTHKIIQDAILDMIISYNLPYYGEFALYVAFIRDEAIKTMGININMNGTPNCFWNENFVNKQTDKSIRFLLVHEIMHLLFDHVKRSMGYDAKLSNLVQDMIINQIIYEDIMYNEHIPLHDYLEMPKNRLNHNSGIFVPKDYTGELIFEELYLWLKKKHEDWKHKNPDFAEKYLKKIIDKLQITSNKNNSDNNEDGDDEKDDEELIVELNKRYGKNGKPFSNYKNKNDENITIEPEMYDLDSFFEDLEVSKGLTLDEHLLNGVSDDVRKQIVERIMNTLKQRGLLSGREEKILNKLRKSEKDLLKDIKRSISNDILGVVKEKTILRANRRDIEGLKGKIKYNNIINCILDTSGSMKNEFEKVLSYIFHNDVIINLIQCDAEVQKQQLIKNKKELQKMTIKGLGGTTITPAINYIASDKKLNKCNTVILTDGCTDILDFKGIKGETVIITTAQEPKVINNAKTVKQFVIKK